MNKAMDYIKDAEYMLVQFLNSNGSNTKLFSREQFDLLVSKAYKNYYGYGMDEEYSIRYAINELAVEYNMTLPM